MSKSTSYYFSHDYNSRSDQKIKSLMVRHGMLGYGIFWAIIEELYNNTNVLRMDYECIAYDLRVDVSIVKSVINDFDLFVFDGDNFGSESVERRINERIEKSKKASESVSKRWERIRANNERNTNVSKSDTIKEIKESKVKEIKEIVIADKSATKEERSLIFFNRIIPFVEEFGKDTCRDFYNYWIESNENGKKMRFEMQKVFDIRRRLTTWKNNERKNFTGGAKKSNLEVLSEAYFDTSLEDKYKAMGD
jgi:hypothetical protein